MPKKTPKKPEYRKILERMLRKYPIYKQMQNVDFPPIVVPVGDEYYIKSGLRQPTTEKYGIRRAERAQLIDQIESALLFLSSDERKLVEETYFSFEREPVYIICDRLGLSKTAYFDKKRRILKRMAEALGLI